MCFQVAPSKNLPNTSREMFKIHIKKLSKPPRNLPKNFPKNLPKNYKKNLPKNLPKKSGYVFVLGSCS